MKIKKRLSVLLLAVFLCSEAADLMAAKSGKGVEEAKSAIAAAEKAQKMAASVDSEWRDTGKLIKQAKEALKAGELEKSMRLASLAKAQGELGYEQGMSQQELTLPSYFKVGGSSPSTVGSAMAPKSHKITTALPSVDVKHGGGVVTIARSADENAVIPEAYASVARECPPFCIQPMSLGKDIETIGELEVLEYLKRVSEGDPTVLVIDSRTADWMVRGTIPGSVNVPWNKINMDVQGSFATQAEADSLDEILEQQFHARKANGKWDFRNAKTLVMFCNGIWCPQSSANIRTLVKLGYPAYKLKWYRGGMQSWVSAGLTTVNQ